MTEQQWLECANPHAMLSVVADRKPGAMRRCLAWLGIPLAKYPSRKHLLFAAACCRRVEHILAQEQCRYALEIAERCADEKASRQERRRALQSAAIAALNASGPRLPVGGWLATAQARAAEAVVAALDEEDPANRTAAATREAMRAWTKATAAANVPSITTATFFLGSNRGEPVPPGKQEKQPVAPEQAAWDAEAKMQCEFLRDLFRNPIRAAATVQRSAHLAKSIALAKSIYDERAFDRISELGDTLRAEGCEESDVLAHCCERTVHIRGCWVVDWLLGK